MSSFARTTNHLADQIKDSASSARGSLVDFGAQAMTMERNAIEAGLRYLGLQRRQSALRPAVYFAAGVLAAGAAAIALSPTLRQRLFGASEMKKNFADAKKTFSESKKNLADDEKRIATAASEKTNELKNGSETKTNNHVIDLERPRVIPPTRQS